MSSLPRLWPAVACLTTAAALYVSRGVLDQAVIGGRAVRIAFLPPWETFAGFLALSAVVLLLIDRLNRRRGSGQRSPLAAIVLPALALWVLGLPFLPALPDRWPFLQVLAGPLSAVVWLVVGVLLLWAWWQHRLVTAGRLSRLSLAQMTVLIGLVTALMSAVAANRLTGTLLFPSGDEPHYLVLAQSLWRDRDFKIENNHQRGDYLEYFSQTLDPHYLTRGSDGEIYSIHPVGLPVLLAPVYAAGGYRAVVWALIGMGAVAAALAWRWVVATLNRPGAATFAWAVIATSAPFLLNSFTVYPEIAAALAVMIGITARNPVVVGAACGALPWLSTKYAPMSLVLLVLSLPWPWTRHALFSREIVGRVVPYGVALLVWFAFFYVFWGSPMPQAPYGAMVQTTPANLVFGAPGLLFDQEYGLLPYAPAYILAASGLWVLWREGGERRVMGVRVLLVFVALVGTVGAFRIWWGGSAAPARPLVSGLLLLTLPIAAAFSAASPASPRRAAQHLLLAIGGAIAVTLTFAQDGMLIANGRDGTSALLEWWSPRWAIWAAVPTFIHHEASTALVQVAAWLIVSGLAAVVLARARTDVPGRAALMAFGVFAAAITAAALVVPMLPADPPLPGVNLAARSRLPALDSFDTRQLPAAVVFDPLRKIAAADALPLFSLGVVPLLRTDPQPLRVIHNGRFSLPAGTYRIDVVFAGDTRVREDRLGLQLGRTGPPFRTWTVDPSSRTWSDTVMLPLDVGFVGFRGSLDLEKAIQSITITPTQVTSRAERPRTPPVLGAGLYPSAMVFFHDDHIGAEAPGFWVLGRRSTQLTFAAPPGTNGPITLRLRSGVADNHVTLATSGWTESRDLARDEPQEVTLPRPRHGVVSLAVTTSEGFVPLERDPGNRDRRLLGVWIETVPGSEP